MEYELAARLKEAGFPQKGRGDFVQPRRIGVNASEQQLVLSAYAPTLSELIEACGDDLAMVVVDDEECVALEQYDWERDCWRGQKGLGSSPQAAVARLWLALYADEAASIWASEEPEGCIAI